MRGRGETLSQVKEVQEAATNSSESLATVLRKCQVLAHRLKHEPLQEWVGHELNGYRDGVEVPEYRSLRTTVQGNFMFGNLYVPGHPIPIDAVRGAFQANSLDPEDPEIERLFVVELGEGVAHYEALLAERTATDGLDSVWSAEAVHGIGSRLFPGANCLRVWRVVTPATIAGFLDTVRNKVLAFALKIGDEFPEEGQTAKDVPSAETLDRVFELTISGDSNTVVINSTNVAIDVQAGDLASLHSALSGLGVDAELIRELDEAIEADADVGLGARIGGWIKKAAAAVGTEAATTGIIQAVMTYLGIT